ncbi:MAG: superoxide dismutase family protein [Nitrospiraceae bacterium]|nr:MAG: superoxide dismutase family protein [Nitrospiraceae bacterium]
MKKSIVFLYGAVIVFMFAGVVPAYEGMGEKGLKAAAQIQGCTDAGITGTAKFKERKSVEGVKVVDVHLMVKGLSDGKHAVHIHETGACEPCGAAQGHFDPGPHGFTSPDGNHPFHSGDLINIESRSGNAEMKTITSRVTLSPGPLSIADADGSAIIIHTNPDSYCPEGVVSGCAGGARDACGIIQVEKGAVTPP